MRPRFAGVPTIRTSLLAVALILAVTGLTGVQVAAAAPASAAACWQSTCNGKDPEQLRCSAGAYNLAAFSYGGSNQWLRGALLELRYSPSCDAAWVRTTGGDCFGVWRPCGSVLETSTGASYWGNPGPGQRWTAMHSFRDYVRGCFMLPDWNGSYSRDGCTAWR